MALLDRHNGGIPCRHFFVDLETERCKFCATYYRDLWRYLVILDIRVL